MKAKRVVVMGGGTGSYTVLTALKNGPYALTAVVAMTDDGGSSGVLRDDLGVLPPGDIRQCLVALSEAPLLLRNLFTYRFENGCLKGHSFGNLFLSALEKTVRSFERSVEEIGKILRIRGKVVPVTLSNVRLAMRLRNGVALKGERAITPSPLIQQAGIRSFIITPKPRPNAKALEAIRDADAILIGPGNLYTSIVPLFLVPGIAAAVRRSRARKILIANLMTKEGQTDGFSAQDFAAVVERYLGRNVLDAVLYNTTPPDRRVLARYLREKSEPLRTPLAASARRPYFIGANLLGRRVFAPRRADSLIAATQQRSIIRHDPQKLAAALGRILRSTKNALPLIAKAPRRQTAS